MLKRDIAAGRRLVEWVAKVCISCVVGEEVVHFAPRRKKYVGVSLCRRRAVLCAVLFRLWRF